MKLYYYLLVASMLFGVAHAQVVSTEDNVSSPSMPAQATREMTAEEMRIGRFGEEDVPEGEFRFSEAENLLWLSDHFASVKQPMQLYYEFVKSGSYEDDAFSDAVYLHIIKLNADGTKDTRLEFFTAERKQEASPENQLGVLGNPVLGIYMQGDIYEMQRLTDGHWRHFQKMLKIALRESASVEDVSFVFNDKTYDGKRIFLTPYLKDPHRSKFEQLAKKSYEFILSADIPGSLYSIKTLVDSEDDTDIEPLILETLVLTEIK